MLLQGGGHRTEHHCGYGDMGQSVTVGTGGHGGQSVTVGGDTDRASLQGQGDMGDRASLHGRMGDMGQSITVGRRSQVGGGDRGQCGHREGNTCTLTSDALSLSHPISPQ